MARGRRGCGTQHGGGAATHRVQAQNTLTHATLGGDAMQSVPKTISLVDKAASFSFSFLLRSTHFFSYYVLRYLFLLFFLCVWPSARYILRVIPDNTDGDVADTLSESRKKGTASDVVALILSDFAHLKQYACA